MYCCMLAVGYFVHYCERGQQEVTYCIYCKLCDIMIAVCWQEWRDIREEMLLLWAKAVMMLDWGSSTLDITTAGIVGISYCCTVLCIALCWCWQCLLTVGANLLPYILTPLVVTTVPWCCRQTQDVLHPAECQPAALQTSESQWKECVITKWICTGGSCSVFTADKCLHACCLYWTGITDSVSGDTVHHIR